MSQTPLPEHLEQVKSQLRKLLRNTYDIRRGSYTMITKDELKKILELIERMEAQAT
jgi:hypothetical protein